MKNIYITTALPYLNGNPHIGHALDYLLADVYYRYHKLNGDNIRFQAGTDEHGNKVFEKALSAKKDPQTFTDEMAQKFKDFIELLDVHYTDFIRTTSSEHESRCQKIWLKLQPHIYKAEYEGWYCKGCERFIPENEQKENPVCPDHQKPYERLAEENYYLRISDFKDKIRSAIESDELLILPSHRKQEVLALLEDTKDISISRPKTSLTWGIPVPNDDTQTMYVWIDALASYLTVLGYPDNNKIDWPADVQFVGKDILRFHAIIWPAILLGLDLALPKSIHSHGHILSNNQKMSKSLGNVVDPIETINLYGSDPFRYFFLRHIDSFADSDFTAEKYENAYNNELANDLGNLVQRLANLCRKNSIKNLKIDSSKLDFSEFHRHFQNNHFSRAFDELWSKIQSLNKRIDEEKPWELAKTNPGQAKITLENLVSDLLSVNYWLSIYLPKSAAKIEEIFTNDKTPLCPLFPKNQ